MKIGVFSPRWRTRCSITLPPDQTALDIKSNFSEVGLLKDRNRAYIGKVLRIVLSINPPVGAFRIEKVHIIILPSSIEITCVPGSRASDNCTTCSPAPKHTRRRDGRGLNRQWHRGNAAQHTICCWVKRDAWAAPTLYRALYALV